MSIERKAISALKWATAAKLVVQLASWAGIIAVPTLMAGVRLYDDNWTQAVFPS